MKTSIIVTGAVCLALLFVHLYFGTLRPSVEQYIRHSSKTAAAQDNPVLTALKAAASGDRGSRFLAQQREDSVHNTSCCRIGAIQDVLAAAAALQKAAATMHATDNVQESRGLMVALRQHVAKAWTAALDPVVS
jgi:hypothetical protein